MGLSNDLLSQFAKVTNSTKKTNKETTVYGTVKEYDNKLYVQFDGSDLLTPTSTTAGRKHGERVMVQIKDHSATIIGNITSPSASAGDMTDIANGIVFDKVDTEVFNATTANINERLNATTAAIGELSTNKLDAETAKITYATINNLNATNANVADLQTKKLDASVALITYATIENLAATNARVTTLETSKLDAETAKITYADISFTNINMAAVENLFNKSGIIKDLVVGEANITGELVGVTIKGDLIQANTLVADRIITQGTDGLYYKLNTDGMKVEAEQTEYNSLNGSVIITKSITATKINVSDLSAFNATIGGFKLTENSIYSGVKESVDNTTTGIYLDNQGQISIGDSTNFIKYYKNQNGVYKLDISSESLSASLNNLQIQIDRINERFEQS